MPVPKLVVVHPLVLLSVVDHYARVAKDTKNRVVGVLLGTSYKGRLDVTNSYAVPFEDDSSDSKVWYFDHNYHEEMYRMFHKVNAKEKVIGWYSTGPELRDCDIEVHELMRRYTPDPCLVVINVSPDDTPELPTKAYVSVDNTPEEQSRALRTFVHIPSEIEATEPEEVGVEHLLREIRDIGGSTVADLVSQRLDSLHGLDTRLELMQKYLADVHAGRLPPNHKILYDIQNVFNLLPNLSQDGIKRAFTVNTNDNMLALYVASMVRSIVALHNLINNKLRNRELEEEEAKKENAASKSKNTTEATASTEGPEEAPQEDEASGEGDGEQQMDQGE